MQIIEAIEHVCNNTSLFFQKTKKDPLFNEAIKAIIDFYNVDHYSALIIALTIKEYLYGKTLKLEKLFKSLEIGLPEILKLKSCITDLQKKGWIIKVRRSYFKSVNSESEEISPGNPIIDSTTKNDNSYLLPKYTDDLLMILLNANIFINGVIDTFTEEDLIDCYLSFFQPYRHHFYINEILTYKVLDDVEKCIILWMSSEVIRGRNSFDLNDIINIFLGSGAALKYKERAYDGDSNLLNEKFIECNKPGFIDLSDVRLGDKMYEKIDKLGILKKNKGIASKLMLIIKPEQIVEKKLYFNENSEKELHKISQMLELENYQKVMERFEACKMQKAITMMFYGEPGVGKTEFVKQIAKQTNREIFQIDISTIKNMWVGESEKNINLVFKQYLYFLNHSKTVPILLFNEADALLNVRVNISSAVDQMMNSMQNILLQNLEDFNGIFIATTNLIDNIDGAFDRRLIYKHRFELPDASTKEKILSEQFPEIDQAFISKISKKYDLTGGQIQNIKKKLTTDYILFKAETKAFENIEKYIQDEVFFREEQKQKIGF